MTTGWTIAAVLEEIDEARKIGDHNYEDEMLLISEVVTVDTTSEATAGKDAANYDEIRELAVDGNYGSASWGISLEELERRIKHWKARQQELELKRGEIE